ncbi:GAF domain-containing protein [endosymbiont of Riftia pachyptila]|uniref:histidine kinase n=2 Tax=sulfur-oxidizing symbionts TaxID=32036 RepID=G2DA74_9GAMM|nr:GAF domain-containing protein [endosymbiont of Riftia pachyptila]EGV52475.1 response regulator receiver [endosymbiont of Riftia pachyptila (vent Ph05)]
MKSVLIVDDREDDLYMLRVLLEGHGHAVVSASNGEDALKAARKSPPDIIISDIMMPVMDGFRLCCEWMTDERLQNIPFVFYSATYTETKDEEFALSLGAARFIIKPTEPDKFMKIIQSVVRDLDAGKIELRTPTLRTGEEVLRLYDERLINKLEKKTLALEKEITERKRAEEKLHKANRLYATLSQVNQAIVKERDKQKLFQTICNIAIKFGKFRLVWIGLLDEENQLVDPVAFSGEGSDYLQNIKISLTDDLTGKGPTGRSIREGKSVVFNDLETNPEFAPWRERALEKGYRSSGAFPIRLDNTVIGALNVYAVEPHFFDAEEINLLEETARDISFALDKFEEETNRRQAMEALRQAGLIIENSPVVLFRWKAADGWPVELVSDNVTQFGYTPEELRSGETPFASIVHPDDRERVTHKMQDYSASGMTHFQQEYRIVTPDGDVHWIDDRTTAEQDADGNITHYQGIVIDITERKLTEAELAAQLDELRRWHDATLGREGRSLELKHEVNALLTELGLPPRYSSVEEEGKSRD